jgi:hypothetical protein
MPLRVIAAGRSCLECRRRKIKCDRCSPCSYCVRTHIECAYPTARTTSSIDAADGDVLGRVERIEEKLHTFERDLSEIKQLLQTRPPSHSTRSHHYTPEVGGWVGDEGRFGHMSPSFSRSISRQVGIS